MAIQSAQPTAKPKRRQRRAENLPTPETIRLVPTAQEAERERAEQAERRVAELEAELKRLRGE